MPTTKPSVKSNKNLSILNFTISTGGGDGANLCYKKVTAEIADYFEIHALDIEEYALDSAYAEINNIPEKMEPFNPGDRAAFGSYESVMTIDNELTLTVENEGSDQIFYGAIPKTNIKKNKKASAQIKDFEKGVYAVGYEGLEDCYISGQLELDSDFDIKNFKVEYTYLDLDLGSREYISSISYDNQDVVWSIDSYEGTGDNSFGFVTVK